MRAIGIIVLSLVAVSIDARTRAVRKPSAEAIVHYRGDAERSGVYPARGPRAFTRIAWQMNIPGGATFSPPVYANGVVHVPTAAGSLAAFVAGSGALRFNSTRLGGFISAPAISSDAIYVASEANSVRVLDGAGALVRSFTTDDWVIGSPIIRGGFVYFGTESRKFLAVDVQTGAQRWQLTTTRPIHTPPAFSDSTLFVSSFDTIFALDPASGAERWHLTRADGLWMALTAKDGVVYTASSAGELLALDARTGATKWSITIPDAGWRFLTIHNGMLFAAKSKDLIAFEAVTGRQLWSFAFVDEPTEPFIADGVVYLGVGSSVYGFEAATGARLFTTQIAGQVQAGVAIGEGRLFVAGSNGILYALE